MSETIKDIKSKLQHMLSISELERSEYNNDARKGVQNAMIQRRKQLEKEQVLLDNYVKMTEFENSILAENPDALICGIDEVGRGPLAGPVVTCAVILNKNHHFTGLNDSKKLSAKQRHSIEGQLLNDVYAYAYGYASVEEIDEINIYEATKLAMHRAIEGLRIKPTHLLVDAMTLDIDIPQTSLIKGDARSVSIAAASVLAKEHRDQYMRDLGRKYPGYGFENNVGYGTQQHLDGIKKYGILNEHRKTFEPIKSLVN
ncbi:MULTISPECIES: ribonuclease HII [Staphylococcus]|uniref:Ribonuclease HII n=1 Tax=Staphylococcus saprophyticus TaxID=29385 RepID=A0A380HNR4_STASA|nr:MULTISPECIES: ribonuclease HII [Staphylococcus]KIJ86342.1 ribonuclease HII [Staphylococcus saprophyticus]MBN6204751.1 ribonuclease HII [Staphylococcus saprophyticus]MCC4221205.1 ribonuclease HII [Staphylococcus saprophyticus]MDW3851753.1 ribonuclease HII [Staphylococcus saprophyticus]MDW3929128.1 ribonuclease HII [Staphylococcus saprophyticus]